MLPHIPRFAQAAGFGLAVAMPCLGGAPGITFVDRSSSAVSRNGQVVLGDFEVFTPADGWRTLPSLDGRDMIATALSADGKWAVGWGQHSASDLQAVRWNLNSMTVEAIPGMTKARAISDDGRVVAGGRNDGSLDGDGNLVRWEKGRGSRNWGRPLGEDGYTVDSIDGAGHVIGGASHRFNNFVPGTWGTDTSFIELDDGPIYGGGLVRDMTPDASLMVGHNDSHFQLGLPLAWTPSSAVPIVLDTSSLPDVRRAAALGVSDDGSLIVGRSRTDTHRALMWMGTDEPAIDLGTYASTTLGLDLSGARLISAHEISGDGKTIVGGALLDGDTVGYVLHIPTPSTLAIMVSATLLPLRRRPRRK